MWLTAWPTLHKVQPVTPALAFSTEYGTTPQLIAIIKKELKLDASLSTLLKILSVSVFEKTPILWAFLPEDHGMAQPANDKQLNLFGF